MLPVRIALFLFMLFSAASAQTLQKSAEEENGIDEFIPGRCYHKILFKPGASPDERFQNEELYIKIFEPEYEEYTDTIMTKPPLSVKSAPHDFYFINRKLMITPPANRYYIEKTISYPGDLQDKMERSIIVCVEKTLPEFKIIRKSIPKEYLLRHHTTKVKMVSPQEYLVVRRKRLINDGYFKVMRRSAPEEFNQVDSTWTRFEPGAWSTGWRELVTLECCLPGWVNIEDIQKALVENGYESPMNGRLEYPTKAALKKYQKDHHLIQGRIDMSTLQSLGLVK